VSLEQERYAGLISLSDELARATSAAMVCSALTSHAPRVVGGYEAVMFVRDGSDRSEQNHFAPIDRGVGQQPIRPFDALWPISRPGLVTRATAQLPNAPYQALWDALGELSPGSVAHMPVGPRSLLVVLFRAEERQLTRDDWTVLASVAEQAAAANERLEALARVRELSLCDSDTGLGNRRLVELVLQHRFAGAVRGEPLSLVALCVSRAAPEAEPHIGGTTPVRRIAELLRTQQRGSDVAAHFGDGLFVVVLHGAGQLGADAFLRRMRYSLTGTDAVTAAVTHCHRFATPGDLLAAVLALVTVSATHNGASDGAAAPRLVTPAA
jgi:GGDEF domain-containing protein